MVSWYLCNDKNGNQGKFVCHNFIKDQNSFHKNKLFGLSSVCVVKWQLYQGSNVIMS